MDKKELTARAAGTLMEAVYRQNGDIITYLSSTDYDGERISKNIDVPVAHKIGDATTLNMTSLLFMQILPLFYRFLRIKRAMIKSPQLQMMFMEF